MPRKPKDPKAAERQARRRAKQKRNGLERRDVWARTADWPQIMALVAELTERTERR